MNTDNLNGYPMYFNPMRGSILFEYHDSNDGLLHEYLFTNSRITHDKSQDTYYIEMYDNYEEESYFIRIPLQFDIIGLLKDSSKNVILSNRFYEVINDLVVIKDIVDNSLEVVYDFLTKLKLIKRYGKK